MTRVQFATLTSLVGIVALLELAPIMLPDRTAPSWEYRLEFLKDDEFRSEMNRIGKAGWEAISIRRAIDSATEDSKAGSEVVFKRPR